MTRRKLTFITAAFILTFLATGLYVLYRDEIAADPGYTGKAAGLLKIAFGAHLAHWMLLGMLSNYFWDLFREGRSLTDAKLTNLLLPVFVSPIVFYGIWSGWFDQKISFGMNLIAFQNGFFWQVIFSKAGPITPPKPV